MLGVNILEQEEDCCCSCSSCYCCKKANPIFEDKSDSKNQSVFEYKSDSEDSSKEENVMTHCCGDTFDFVQLLYKFIPILHIVFSLVKVFQKELCQNQESKNDISS